MTRDKGYPHFRGKNRQIFTNAFFVLAVYYTHVLLSSLETWWSWVNKPQRFKLDYSLLSWNKFCGLWGSGGFPPYANSFLYDHFTVNPLISLTSHPPLEDGFTHKLNLWFLHILILGGKMIISAEALQNHFCFFVFALTDIYFTPFSFLIWTLRVKGQRAMRFKLDYSFLFWASYWDLGISVMSFHFHNRFRSSVCIQWKWGRHGDNHYHMFPLIHCTSYLFVYKLY